MKDWDKNIFADDGQFGCPICKGKKQVKLGKNNDMTCPGCEGTGHLVDYLASQVEYERSNYNSEIGKYRKLVDWVRGTSTCKTCGGNSHKTFGGTPCKECGLEGTKPWGG